MSPTSVAPDEILHIKQHCYTWNRFHELVHAVKKQINIAPNLIVSIGKGGSIPGVVLAEMFECNNINLGLKSYKGGHRGNIHEYQSIGCFNGFRDANILIVDDLADSGETFLYAVKKFKGNGCEKIRTASVFYKPCSKFKPDYFAEEVDSKTWIVQPWETMQAQ